MVGHPHGHHDHSHHGSADYNRAFAIGAALNLLFVVVEAVYGYWSNSLALVADAGHNFSDVIGLLLAWIAAWLSTRKPSKKFTYGLGHTSILAALANALLLLIAVGAIIWEAVHRIGQPQDISTTTVVVVAAIGIVINTATALLFMSGRKKDLNIRGAYLHMAADAMVSAGVVVAALIISYTGWIWLDPMMSILIGVVILLGTWGLLRDSLNMVVAAVPPGIDLEDVKAFLAQSNGVHSVHDLHIWAMSTTGTALTAHIVMKDGHPGDKYLKVLAHDLEHRFNIHHATIQVELGDDGGECEFCPDDTV